MHWLKYFNCPHLKGIRFNPYKSNYLYHQEIFIFNFRGVSWHFSLFSNINRAGEAPDQIPHHLIWVCIFCLCPQKRMRLIWVNGTIILNIKDCRACQNNPHSWKKAQHNSTNSFKSKHFKRLPSAHCMNKAYQ